MSPIADGPPPTITRSYSISFPVLILFWVWDVSMILVDSLQKQYV